VFLQGDIVLISHQTVIKTNVYDFPVMIELLRDTCRKQNKCYSWSVFRLPWPCPVWKHICSL